MSEIISTPTGNVALVGDIPVIDTREKKPISEEQKNTMAAMFKDFIEKRTATDNAFIAMQEYVKYVRKANGIPENERWEISKDGKHFVKSENQPAPGTPTAQIEPENTAVLVDEHNQPVTAESQSNG